MSKANSMYITPRKLSGLNQLKKRSSFINGSLNSNPSRSANQQSANNSPQRTSRQSKQQFDTFGGKLPLINIKKVLKKIGATQRNQQIFIPNQSDQASFRKQKWRQLKQRYSIKKTKPMPFQHELDPIVLDCWQYGQNFGRKTVWRKYRQNFDDLTYDTLKAIKKKK